MDEYHSLNWAIAFMFLNFIIDFHIGLSYTYRICHDRAEGYPFL